MANKFSIIVPVYNASKIIEGCIKSIASQTYRDFELLLINDGSKDDSAIVVENLCRTYDIQNYRIITKENGGAGSARNLGLSLATGEYILFIDSDDYVDCDYLENILSCIENEGADIIFVDIVRELMDGTVLRKESMSDFKNLSKDRLIRNQLTGKMPWGGVRKAIRRSIVVETGAKYATNIRVGEESIYSFLILNSSSIISFQPKAIYHYVENSASLTSNDKIEQQKDVFDFIRENIESMHKYYEYEDTISALAITAIITGVNLLSKGKFSFTQYKTTKLYAEYYEKFISNRIDKDSLDIRVRRCLPLIKCRFYFLLYIMAYINNKIR